MTATVTEHDEKYHGLTAEQIEKLGEELDAIRQRVIADLGETDAAYLRKVVTTQRKLEIAGRALFYLRRRLGAGRGLPERVEDPRQHGDRAQRDARAVRLPGRPGLQLPHVRLGHRVPGRAVEVLAQLHPPHLHQHRRQGPRRGLRDPADGPRAEVAPVLPRQPALRVPADDLLRVGASRCTTSRWRTSSPASGSSPTTSRSTRA